MGLLEESKNEPKLPSEIKDIAVYSCLFVSCILWYMVFSGEERGWNIIVLAICFSIYPIIVVIKKVKELFR